MNVETIIKRINTAIENLEKEDFVSGFPTIINDLHYIYFTLKNDRDKLDNEEQFRNGPKIECKILEYFTKLTQKYMQAKYNKNINIEPLEEYSMALASGGYNPQTDKINYSVLGQLLGKVNESSYFDTFLHESRHKMQFDTYKTTNIEEILKFPGNIILLIKEEIYHYISKENDSKFYFDNYNYLYTETDAENFSLETVWNFIMDLYLKYIEYADNNGVKIDENLNEKVIDLHLKIEQDSYEIKHKQEQMQRLNPEIIEELLGQKLITTSYVIENGYVDRLIELDKTIKNHPELQEQMPLLKLLFNGNVPKTYNEIMEDKQQILAIYPQYKDEINNLYQNIIKTDPTLYLTDLVVKNETELISNFIFLHPTILEEYSEEIQYIISITNNEEIIRLLTTNNKKR